MENNEIKDVLNEEEPKKRKSRFGVVLGVVIVTLALVFSYLTLSQKEKYRVLDNSSKEVKSIIGSIKDIRTLKGYKVIDKSSDNKLVMISAGLSYDPNGSIEVMDIEFGKNSAKIVVKENIDKNPEKEKVTYPFVIVKLSSEISTISVVDESGEEYEEIFLNKHTNEEPVKAEDNEEEEVESSEEEDKEAEEELEDEEVEEVEEVEEEVVQTKTLTCTYEGKADGTTIEISVGDQYRTFDISDVSKSFDNMEIGRQITIEYIDSVGNGKIVSVK